MQVAELYRGHAGFDVHALVAELVEAESVPFLPVLRYKASGLRKREIWERTWELQRREDAIDAEVAATLHAPAGRERRAVPGASGGRTTAPQAGRNRRHPTTAQVHLGRFPEHHLLAAARPARRAQRALYQLPLLLP